MAKRVGFFRVSGIGVLWFRIQLFLGFRFWGSWVRISGFGLFRVRGTSMVYCPSFFKVWGSIKEL